jgi:demethylmenaquinone methyltransferase/2-methoxy-6-polyprenyl-1,4-benzoquinol methylase
MEGPVDRTQAAASAKLNPHPVLEEHYSTDAERVSSLRGLFDASAGHYDWINRVLSVGTGVRYRRRALERAGLAPGMRVLDVGCGTGVISQLAVQIVGDRTAVVSVDPSAGMREEARRRRSIEVVEGVAEKLPVATGSVDFLVMGYALRHVADLRAGFDEFRRVLRPGGRLLLLEITAPESNWARRVLRLYFRRFIPGVSGIFSREAQARKLMIYHWDSIEYCVRPEEILDALADSGFDGARRRVELGIFSEYTAFAS